MFWTIDFGNGKIQKNYAKSKLLSNYFTKIK
jgi:hypothetical protein